MLYKTQSYTTHTQIFQIPSFAFVNKPSSTLSLSTAVQANLSLHVGLKF